MRTLKNRVLIVGGAGLVAAGGVSLAVAMTGGTLVPAPVADRGMVFLDFTYVNVVSPGYTQRNNTSCSGTLLSPTWVLTARHCVAPMAADFNAGTAMVIPTPDASGHAVATAWDPVGDRFVVAGWVPDPVTPEVHRPALWAFDRSARVPAGFGEASPMTIPRLTGVDSAELVAVATAPGGYVAAGTATVGGVDRLLVLRFDRDGRLVQTPYPAPASIGSTAGFAPAPAGRARAVAVDPASGDVIVVGSQRDPDGRERWAAARFDPLGGIRPAYGYLATSPHAGALHGVAVVNGAVVVLGAREVGVAALGRPALAVLGDAAVGARVDHLGGWTIGDHAVALAADGAGRVVVVGRSHARDRVLATRHAVPSLASDPSYGPGGVATRLNEVRDRTVEVVDAEIDRAGRVVVGLRLDHSGGYSAFSVARFTAGGRPDPEFGQGGLVLVDGERSLHSTGLALAPDHVLVVGNTLSPTPAAMLINAMQDHLPTYFRARLGDSSAGIARVLRHPDASIDAALVELAAPIAAPGAVRFRGFVDPNQLTGDQRVTCYGYGGVPNDLRAGDLIFAGLDDRSVLLASVCSTDGVCEAQLEGGDSGGACFVDHDPRPGATWRQLGVTSRIAASLGDKTWYPGSIRQYLDRGDAMAAWIETVTPLDVTP